MYSTKTKKEEDKEKKDEEGNREKEGKKKKSVWRKRTVKKAKKVAPKRYQTEKGRQLGTENQAQLLEERTRKDSREARTAMEEVDSKRWSLKKGRGWGQKKKGVKPPKEGRQPRLRSKKGCN